tara:strand:+ start:6263 stop:6499 length:237 start_codon:yes stop_codon:yes gene_type:complete
MKKLFTITLVFIISIFIDSQIALSLEESAINNEKIIKEDIRIKKNKDDSLKSDSNSGDIFGDEQTFPFVAGLGKNAAH